jgi:hypothetical protein
MSLKQSHSVARTKKQSNCIEQKTEGVTDFAEVTFFRPEKNLKLPASIVILFSMKPEASPNVAITCLSSEWPWPASLDALVAAPEHHRKISENDRVRVLEVHPSWRNGSGAHTQVASYSLSTELERPCAARRDW